MSNNRKNQDSTDSKPSLLSTPASQDISRVSLQTETSSLVIFLVIAWGILGGLVFDVNPYRAFLAYLQPALADPEMLYGFLAGVKYTLLFAAISIALYLLRLYLSIVLFDLDRQTYSPWVVGLHGWALLSDWFLRLGILIFLLASLNGGIDDFACGRFTVDFFSVGKMLCNPSAHEILGTPSVVFASKPFLSSAYFLIHLYLILLLWVLTLTVGHLTSSAGNHAERLSRAGKLVWRYGLNPVLGLGVWVTFLVAILNLESNPSYVWLFAVPFLILAAYIFETVLRLWGLFGSFGTQILPLYRLAIFGR